MTKTAWHKKLRQRGCMLSESFPVQLHHCHGGSMKDVLPPELRPGWGQRASDWLVVPLHPRFHVGEFGIDNGMGIYKGVVEWEQAFCTQVSLIDMLCIEFAFNVWEQIGVEHEPT